MLLPAASVRKLSFAWKGVPSCRLSGKKPEPMTPAHHRSQDMMGYMVHRPRYPQGHKTLFRIRPRKLWDD
eukprot:3218489-Alexandrium_andersonii.AAC.1